MKCKHTRQDCPHIDSSDMTKTKDCMSCEKNNCHLQKNTKTGNV